MNLIGNLIVCYVILGILILLFRKIKTASAVFCWLLILLALINFFVMEFRGEAFFLLDITGIGTAADVAGEYEFKIPLMLGIPLTYSLGICPVYPEISETGVREKKQKKFDCAVSLFSCVCCGNGSGISAFDHEAGKCFIVECKQGISE